MLILIGGTLFAVNDIMKDKLSLNDGKNQYDVPKTVLLKESVRFMTTSSNIKNYNLLMIMMSKMSVRDIYTLISTNNSMLKILEHDNYRSIIDLKFSYALKYQSILSGSDFYHFLFGSPSYVRDVMGAQDGGVCEFDFIVDRELWTNITIYKYLDNSLDVNYLSNGLITYNNFNRLPDLLKFIMIHWNFDPQTCKTIYVQWLLSFPEIVPKDEFVKSLILSDNLSKIKLLDPKKLSDEMIDTLYRNAAHYLVTPAFDPSMRIEVIKVNDNYYVYNQSSYIYGYVKFSIGQGDQIQPCYPNAKKIITYLYGKSLLPKKLYNDIVFLETYDTLLELGHSFDDLLKVRDGYIYHDVELAEWIVNNLAPKKLMKSTISRFRSLESQKLFIRHGHLTELNHLRQLLPDILNDSDAVELLTLLLEHGAVLKKQDFKKIDYDRIDSSVIEWLLAHDLFPELKTLILSLKIIQALMSNGFNINDFSNVKYQTSDLALLKYLYANGITFTDDDLQSVKKTRTSERSRNTRERKKYDLRIQIHNLTNSPPFVPDNTWSDIYDWMVTII